MTSEDFKNYSTAIAAIFVPVVLGFVGNMYSSSIKNKELEGRTLELAITVLRDEPSDKNVHIRKWAIDIINNYSEIKLGEDARDSLIRRVPIGSLVIDKRFNSKIQSMLKEMGYYDGEIDGVLSGSSIDAIKLFQRNNGLVADGSVGAITSGSIRELYNSKHTIKNIIP